MNRIRFAWMVLFSVTFILTASFVYEDQPRANAFTQQVIQRGAVGNDVIELQARLQYIGYYHGKIDGVYGWSTYWAVRNFQHDYGLENVDGLVGLTTKQKLVNQSDFNDRFVHLQLAKGKDFTHYGGMPLEKQTGPSKKLREQMRTKNQGNGKKIAQNQGKGSTNNKPAPSKTPSAQKQKSQNTAVNMPAGYSQNDIQLMANAVYGESRGESYVGQVAVAAVILNRIESPTFPDTASGVIFEPGAFTAVADGQIWLEPNAQAKKAVLDAINGWDPTENALYYFNPDTATSGWIWGRPQIKQIGKHIFCK
ncbi:spore cortex-lytic enzyme [Bacillus sp. FJAT-42376]|uniref:spore cortex-lytic enzyme n=1 Tax=Bacillus sp. FJAT-42376 TaxID=2014076 RepID=UPI000F4E2AAF|nr:spore cortex-lytic enzyme [Bacillus sp. FJAT-42376]AZB43360.1 spore cortex-lytic enzyme [Bacillus sp. FJAT-42376]